MRSSNFLIALALAITGGCATPAQSGNPEWVDALIRAFEDAPVGNPPQSIWRYAYDSQVVYFVPAQCCDMFSTLYDAEGNILCAPGGGLDGRGDGRCPSFADERTQKQLVWQDPRTR
jgi:hypothetical protein